MCSPESYAKQMMGIKDDAEGFGCTAGAWGLYGTVIVLDGRD